MITYHDLQEAIAACEGDLNPNANTCIKLAAFYTIRNEMFPDEAPAYSFAPPPVDSTISYSSDTEFGRAIAGKSPEQVWPVMDELMEAVQVLQPRLYASVLRKL